jgi:hypothetical protein
MSQRTMDDYIKFFKNKPLTGIYTDKFIKEYQQSGGGYISFARAIAERDPQKCDGGQREYCNYLLGMKDKKEAAQKIAELLGIDPRTVEEMNPLEVTVNREQGEPNQKWHLFLSWFGWKKYIKKEPAIDRASCPELWLWMFESSGVFDEEEVKELYEKAVAYKKASSEWNGVLKAYRQKLETKMENIPENC